MKILDDDELIAAANWVFWLSVHENIPIESPMITMEPKIDKDLAWLVQRLQLCPFQDVPFWEFLRISVS